MKKKELVHLRLRKLQSGTLSYYLDYWQNKKRVYENLCLYLVPERTAQDRAQNANTTRAAERIKAQRIMEITGEKCGLPVLPKICVCDFLEDQKKSKSTYKQISRYIKLYTKNRPPQLAEINKAFVLGFASFLENRETLTAGTPAYYVSMFSVSLNKAVKAGYISETPFKHIEPRELPRKATKVREYLTAEEIKKLIDTPTKYDSVKNAFLFSCFTGLRLSDVYAMKWENLQSDSGKMFLHFTQVKTKKHEVLPISEAAQSFLPPANDFGPVFRYYTPAYISVLLKNWIRCAGITKSISFHCARHTFATLEMTAGADLYTICKLLGHTDIKTTQIYTKLVDNKKIEAVELLNNIL